MPKELTRARTLESFRERLPGLLPDLRVVGPPGKPLGFCTIRGDELYQLFVSAEARGSGVAAALVADAEARLAATGVGTAWLACAIGNERAAKLLREVRLAPAGDDGEPAADPGGGVPARGVALREGSDAGRLSDGRAIAQPSAP